jgi:hypothetical protein
VNNPESPRLRSHAPPDSQRMNTVTSRLMTTSSSPLAPCSKCGHLLNVSACPSPSLSPAARDLDTISHQDLRGLLQTVMNRKGLDLDAFEDEVGWELREFMQSPAHVIEQRPVMFLKDLAAVIGVEYARMLPVGSAHAI